MLSMCKGPGFNPQHCIKTISTKVRMGRCTLGMAGLPIASREKGTWLILRSVVVPKMKNNLQVLGFRSSSLSEEGLIGSWAVAVDTILCD